MPLEALTYLLQIINGTWKPKSFNPVAAAVERAAPRIAALRQALPAALRQEAVVRELIIALCGAGHLRPRQGSRAASRSSFYMQPGIEDDMN